jgi:hypothetical protein
MGSQTSGNGAYDTPLVGTEGVNFFIVMRMSLI